MSQAERFEQRIIAKLDATGSWVRVVVSPDGDERPVTPAEAAAEDAKLLERMRETGSTIQEFGAAVLSGIWRPDPNDARYRQYVDAIQGRRAATMADSTLAALERQRQVYGLTQPTSAMPPVPHHGIPADCKHSDDFRSVLWLGENYSFTAGQAAIVRALWEAAANGTPDMSHETLLERADLQSPKLRVIFSNGRRGRHPAWGTMIVRGPSKGTYRLAIPA